MSSETISWEILKAPATIFGVILGRYSLVMTRLDCRDDVFKTAGVVATGHVWEQLIVAKCEEQSIDLARVIFDSESDMFCVYSRSTKALEPIGAVIDSLVSEPIQLVDLLSTIPKEELDGEIWTPEEFVDHLETNRFDPSSSQNLCVSLQFASNKVALEACEIATKDGYECFYDNEFDSGMVLVLQNMVPSETNLKRFSGYFRELAGQLGGSSDGFDLIGDGEMGDHWSRFV